MALTPEGTPYVESTDLVANYPAASLSLANRVDLVGVLPFATSAARATAIPSPTDGQYSYLQDSNSTQFWNGTAWVQAGGKVLQVVTTTKTDTFSATVNVGAETAITGLSLSITPSNSSNKVFIIYQVYGGLDLGGGASGANGIITILKRGATSIGVGDAAGSRRRITAGPQGSIFAAALMNGSGISFLDSPASTSALTYSVSIGHSAGADQVVYVNRTATDTDSTGYYRTISTITAIEVSA